MGLPVATHVGSFPSPLKNRRKKNIITVCQRYTTTLVIHSNLRLQAWITNISTIYNRSNWLTKWTCIAIELFLKLKMQCAGKMNALKWVLFLVAKWGPTCIRSPKWGPTLYKKSFAKGESSSLLLPCFFPLIQIDFVNRQNCRVKENIYHLQCFFPAEALISTKPRIL